MFSYNNRCLDVVIIHTQLRTISEDNKSYIFLFGHFHFQNKTKTFAHFYRHASHKKSHFGCFSWKIWNHFFCLLKIMVFPKGPLWKTKILRSGPFIKKKKFLKLCHVSNTCITHTAMVFHKTKSASKDWKIMHTQWRTISEHEKITISLLTVIFYCHACHINVILFFFSS